MSCDGAPSKGEGVRGRGDGRCTSPHLLGVSIACCMKIKRGGEEEAARCCCLGIESSGCMATAPSGKPSSANRRDHGEVVAQVRDGGRSPGRIVGQATDAQTAGASGLSAWRVQGFTDE